MQRTLEISIPTDWSEISIAKYMKYGNIDTSDVTNNLSAIISILCDVPLEVVEVMKMTDIKRIYDNLHKLISKPVNKDIIKTIEVDGIIYGYHPKLDELTMGEYVDIETFASENELAKMLSVLYRPITKQQGNRYDIEPYDSDVHVDNHHKFSKLSVNIGNPIAVFFWSLGKKLQSSFQSSFARLEENQMVMDGSQSLTD
tara:strand:+ start:1213 stop:1812 length:600 start_codon:yes stop_codon:yes gene_type:complete